MAMNATRRTLLQAGAAAVTLGGGGARAQADDTIRIGVLTDLSGPYKDGQGPVSVACAEQAAAEFTAANPGIKVEVLSADHANRPDTGLSVLRRWFDQRGVDIVTDIGNSAIAIGARSIVMEKDKIALVTSAGSSDLTGKHCSPNSMHWSWDSWCLAKSNGTALVEAGGDTWFFVTPDYAFGHAAQADLTAFVEKAGGRVLGSVNYPFPQTTEFSSFLLQAQSSRAKVVCFTNSGNDLVNSLKQAREFGVNRRGVRLAAAVAYVTDVIPMGLEVAQGLTITETFYWDLNDRTRAFMARIAPRLPPRTFPNMSQAGNYSGVMHYLKAVREIGVTRAKASGRDVVATMKRMPTDDDCFGPGTLRADGRKIHPSYLFEVKSPQESRGPGDVYKLLATTPAVQAFRPLAEGGCVLDHS